VHRGGHCSRASPTAASAELWKAQRASSPKSLAGAVVSPVVVDSICKELRRTTGQNIETAEITKLLRETVIGRIAVPSPSNLLPEPVSLGRRSSAPFDGRLKRLSKTPRQVRRALPGSLLVARVAAYLRAALIVWRPYVLDVLRRANVRPSCLRLPAVHAGLLPHPKGNWDG
jgi:hypothetical protein